MLPRPLLPVMTFLLCCSAAVTWGAAARRSFDLPADTVDRSIRRFSELTGVEVFYESTLTKGLRAAAVKGEMTTSEALEALLAGTGLEVVRDERSRAYSLRRRNIPPTHKPPERPNGQRAAQSTQSDRPENMRKRGTEIGAKAPVPASADAGPVVLSPFEVATHRDIGYTATSALAGSRTDAPLKETAAAVSVITREFIDDLGGTSLRELSEWTVNTVPDYATNQFAFGDYNIHFRGLGTSAPSRNYFLWYVDNDSFNTERYEFARGPNGVLFGDGNAAGIATTWTKRARFGSRAYVASFRADTYGGHRATIDLNQPLGERAALRLNALRDRSEGWHDRTPSARDGAHLAGIVRLTPRTNLRFEGEWGTLERPLLTLNYADQASFWDRTTSYDGNTAPSTNGTGIARVAGGVYHVHIPAVPQAGLSNWGGMYRSVGTGLALRPTARDELANMPALPHRAFNLQPPDSRGFLRYYTYTAYLNFRFGKDLFVELAFYRSRNARWSQGSGTRLDQHIVDVNRVLPSGAPNPKFGVPYADVQRLLQREENLIHDLRVLATHRFEKGPLEQRLSGIAGARLERFDSWAKVLRRTNGPNPNLTAAENLIFERRYWDEPGRYAFGPVPTFPGYVLDFVPTAITHERKPVDHVQLASVTRVPEQRITLTLGLRHDRFERTQRTTSGIPVDPVTGLPRLGAVIVPDGRSNAVPVVGGKATTDVALTTHTVGAVYFILPWLGVFGNSSETFQPPGSGPNLIDGRVPGISRSRGLDFGIKLDLFDGRLAATLNRYISRQTDRLDFTNARAVEINRLWTNLGRSDLATLRYRDTQSFEGRGYEVEVTANPTPSLRLMANYGRPETEATEIKPGLRAYYETHLPQWQAAANATDQSQAAQIRADLAAITADVDGAVPGATLNNTYRYTANLYATFTIREGVARNLSIGAGANFRGKNKVGSAVASPFDYLYGQSYWLLSAHASYRCRLGNDVTARFQVTVANALDNDALITTSYADPRSRGVATPAPQRVAHNFRSLDPRKLTFSTTLEF